MLSSYLNVGCD